MVKLFELMQGIIANIDKVPETHDVASSNDDAKHGEKRGEDPL